MAFSIHFVCQSGYSFNIKIFKCSKHLDKDPMATKFWQKLGKKSHKNGHNFSCTRHINAEVGFEIGFQLSANSSMTPVHKGQRGLTMATNSGTKIAINAFLQEITRIWLLIIGVFMVGQSKEDWLQGSKGRCHDNQILAKIGKKSHKNGHNFSWIRHISAEFCSEIGVQLSVNSSVTLPYTRDKVA